MNVKGSSFIKNYFYSIAANSISLIVSVLVVLIIPKLIGVEEYSYWQLYLFYASYVGFLQFGWNDGIYLRYGGVEYNKLDKKLFFSQFWTLVGSQIILSIIIIILAHFVSNDIDRQLIFFMIALCLIILGSRAMLIFILQATNRIKEYSHIILLDRILYFFLISSFILMGVRNYEFLISADLIGKLISLLYAMFICKDIVFKKINTFHINIQEITKNISVGIKLMFANIASMLIIGSVRFGIERSWDILTFGKVSLTLSISNLMMLFINALGTIMFPVLRRTNENNLPNIYLKMRDFLMPLLLGVLIIYYPLRVLLSTWLPQYEDSLMYMALLFPIFIFEGKMALLISTYLKTLRKEKLMLGINFVSLIISIIFTFFTTQILENLDLAVTSIVLLLAFRGALAEIILSKVLEISLYKDIVLELILSAMFILTSWYINSWLSVFLYMIFYLGYLIIKKKDIVASIQNVRLLIKS